MAKAHSEDTAFEQQSVLALVVALEQLEADTPTNELRDWLEQMGSVECGADNG